MPPEPVIPIIHIKYCPSTDPAIQGKWVDLVGKNLGSEVQKLYRDDQPLSVYEPAKLERESLEAAVALFTSELPEKDKHRFGGHTLLTFQDVEATISAASAKWEKRKRYFPAFQDRLVDFLNSAGHYKNLAAVFPSQGEYTSTFCSALNVLIMAATNYKETAEGLTTALTEITAAAKNVNDLHGLFNTTEMLGHVVNFYASILHFCLIAIKWYQSKKRRLLGTLKDNLYEEVQEIINTIKAHAEIIKETASKGNMAEIRMLHLKMEHQGVVLKKSMEELKHGELKALEEWRDSFFRELDQRTLKATKSRKRSRSKSAELRPPTPKPRLPQIYNATTTLSHIHTHLPLPDVSPARELQACSTNQPLPPHGRFFRERLDSWMLSRSTSILWIRGDPSPQRISPITAFAASLIRSAKAAKIRAVFHLCTFHARDSEPSPILTLLHSLIRQLFEAQDLTFETDIDFSESRFKGAGDSFDAAWVLFEDALKLGSKKMTFVAIDCLERFDGDEHCGLLMRRLEGLAGDGKGRVVKVLLTSKMRTTRVFERLPEEAALRLKSAGTARRGRMGQRRKSEWSHGSEEEEVGPGKTYAGKPEAEESEEEGSGESGSGSSEDDSSSEE